LPAIQIARLKQQLAALFTQVNQPEAFALGLRKLFDLYADRTYRAGQSTPPASRIPSYHIPPLVMLQLKTDLRRVCLHQPDAAIHLAQTLWADPMLEPRLLAVSILGQMPASHVEAVSQELVKWCLTESDRSLRSALLTEGASSLRLFAHQQWMSVIRDWIDSKDDQKESMALQALLPFVNDPQFINLPAVFSALQPLLNAPGASLQTDLQAVLEGCIQRSAVETGFFLRQSLAVNPSPELIRLVRRLLPLLPPTSQDKIRVYLNPA